MKVNTIRIKTVEEGLKDFEKAFKKAKSGKGEKAKTGVFFSSIGAVRKILTPGRIAILKYIKAFHPQSIYEVAQGLNKDLKNVSQDLGYLTEVGLIELKESHGARNRRRPVLISDHIRLEFVV